VREFQKDAARRSFETMQVLRQKKQPLVYKCDGFIHAVAEEKAPVEHGNHGRFRLAYLAIDVDTN
jgi:hypothetical protein